MIKKNKNLLLKNWLLKNNIFFEKDFDLSKRSWIKSGGTAKFVIYPNSTSQLKKILSKIYVLNFDFYPIGNLSNVLFRDGIIFTPLISLKKMKDEFFSEYDQNSLYVRASGGLSIFKFVNMVISKFKIFGLEGLIGIPGTLGAAILTNASSYDSCISDNLVSVKYINEKSEIKTVLKSECKFDWRYSIFQKKKNFIILELFFKFNLKKTYNLSKINSKISEIKNHRFTFQEKKYPNLGSLYATKNLYYDLKNVSLVTFILYLFNIICTKIFYLFSIEQKLIIFRKYLVKLYSYYFGINNLGFKLSDRTINCIVNNTFSKNSSEAFKLISILEKKIKGKVKLENVLVKKIK